MPSTGIPDGNWALAAQCSTTIRAPTGVQRSTRSSWKTTTTEPSLPTALPVEDRRGSATAAIPSLRISHASLTPFANSTRHRPTGKLSGRGTDGGTPGEESGQARVATATKRISVRDMELPFHSRRGETFWLTCRAPWTEDAVSRLARIPRSDRRKLLSLPPFQTIRE